VPSLDLMSVLCCLVLALSGFPGKASVGIAALQATSAGRRHLVPGPHDTAPPGVFPSGRLISFWFCLVGSDGESIISSKTLTSC
jgi:hypothetical protein